MEPEPRIGVYICHCGTNIADMVDVQGMAEFARGLNGVVLSKNVMYACSDPTQQEIEEDIKEQELNRVVVAACSPRIHEPTFRSVLERAGLNKYLFEMANIREQDSWVHEDRSQATEKAKDLVRMAVARARLLQPSEESEVTIGENALVIGGGIAGIQAALDLADAGYKVYLVEKEPFLGGRMAQLGLTFPTLDCSTCILAPKMSEVGRHPNIEILANSTVKRVEGYVGNFTVTVKRRARFVTKDCTSCDKCTEVCPVTVPNEFDMGLSLRKAIYKTFPQAVPAEYAIDFDACLNEPNILVCERCLEVCEPQAIDFEVPPESVKKLHIDTMIIATGANPYDPTPLGEYGYGRYDNVITTMDLERIYAPTSPTEGQIIRPSDHKIPKRIAFIQCVGSRTANPALKQHSYCSRICCMVSIKQSLVIKSKIPDAQVTVYYIDIRAYGKGYEELYERARREGIRFIRGLPGEIREDGDKSLTLVGENILTDEIYRNRYDMVILSVGLEAREDSGELQRTFSLSRDTNGFFIERHPKLEPVDTTTTGIFLAGAAEGPKDIRESSTQAKAAASRASRLMKEGKVEIEALTAMVDKELCNGCGVCEEACPYKAISVDGIAHVTETLCQGCGICAAACPVGAIDMRHYTDEQIVAQIDAALLERPEEKVIVFTSYWCSYSGADMAGTARIKHVPNARIIRLLCCGRVKLDFVLRALEKGAAGVLIAACHPGECHYGKGDQETLLRYKLLKEALREEGVDESRVALEGISAAEGKRFAEAINQFVERVKGLEPIRAEKLENVSRRLQELRERQQKVLQEVAH
jgi:heterodisulfide reductase subunit A